MWIIGSQWAKLQPGEQVDEVPVWWHTLVLDAFLEVLALDDLLVLEARLFPCGLTLVLILLLGLGLLALDMFLGAKLEGEVLGGRGGWASLGAW